MNLEAKIRSLSLLRHEILDLLERDNGIINKAYQYNEWFVPEFVKNALYSISMMLEEEKLKEWTSKYQLWENKNKAIGIIMAGNIPMVGFHDLLTVLLSGNRAIIKLSHSDEALIPYITTRLEKIALEYKKLITFEKTIRNIDAVIATGSDNTSRYFSHIFSNVPRIIRKNRTSCCILNGFETEQDYLDLSKDIFTYFGLGCRNVSKIYIPEHFEIRDLIPYFNNFEWIKDHVKYYNNYLYQSSKNALEHHSFIDGQFFIFVKNNDMVSPVSCLFYEEYEDPAVLKSTFDRNHQKIQCKVSKGKWFDNSVTFGMTQYPDPWDYADNIDTMAFLSGL
jgi:hypothetical protein